MSAHILRSSCKSGELSPLMDSRVDAENYSTGCRRLENFIPRIYGGAFRRVGTMFLGIAKDESKPVRLFPFNYSGDTAFVIEVGDAYMRIWSDGELVNDVDGNTLEIVTPWRGSRVFDIQFVQLNDVCFFSNLYYRPQRLIRYADNDWRLDDLPFSFPSLGDQNSTDVTGKVYTVGADDFFEFENFDADNDYPILFDVSYRTALDPSNSGTSDWIGCHLQIVHRRDSSSVELALTATADSAEMRVNGSYELFTYGTWAGTLKLQRKVGAAWETIRDFNAKSDRNFQYQGQTVGEETLRLSLAYTSHTATPRAVLEAADSRVYGLVKVLERVSISKARVEVIQAPLDSTASASWSMEAFNGVWGYPSAIAFHEQRLIFAANKRAPTTFWGSQTGDFLNFERGTDDAQGFAFTLAAQEGSAIRSVLSHSNLLLFTETEEWSVATSEKTALTPTNPYVRRHSRYGSANQQAVIAGQGILFLERGARKLREYSYSEYESNSIATDLTVLSEHITKSGIKQFAIQSDPDPVIWCVMNDGGLASMTLEREQGVVGWARHPTDGRFESVTVTYGDSENGDQIWFVVSREINGVTRKFIERFDPNAIEKTDSNDVSRMVYSDCAVLVERSDPFGAINGLDHLEGKAVAILGDGNVLPPQVVTNAAITLDRQVSTCVVGIPFTSMFQPSRIEMGMDDGTAQSRTFRMARATVNLWKSLGLEQADNPGASEQDWFELVPADPTIPFGSPQQLFTGEKDLVALGKHRSSVEFALRQNAPLPANILGVVMKIEVEGE